MAGAKIETVAEQLVKLSGEEPIKIFAFQEVFELKKKQYVQGWVWMKGWAEKQYERALLNALNDNDNDHKYVLKTSTGLCALRMVVFVRQDYVCRVSVSKLDPYSGDKKFVDKITGKKGAVAVHVRFNDKSVLVGNVHLPSGDGDKHDKERVDMFEAIKEKYSAYKGDNFYEDEDSDTKKAVIMVGDFNARLKLLPKTACDNATVTAGLTELQNKLNPMEKEDRAKFDWAETNSQFQGKDNLANVLNASTLEFFERHKAFLPTYSPHQHSLKDGDEQFSITLDGQIINYLKYKKKWGPNAVVKKDKHYLPAWTDRIFLHGDGVQQSNINKYIKKYESDHSFNQSDHFPVYAVIEVP